MKFFKLLFQWTLLLSGSIALIKFYYNVVSDAFSSKEEYFNAQLKFLEFLKNTPSPTVSYDFQEFFWGVLTIGFLIGIAFMLTLHSTYVVLGKSNSKKNIIRSLHDDTKKS